jgi:hypothetical protein
MNSPAPPPKVPDRFAAYVRDVTRLLRASKHRLPRTDGADLEAESASLEEQVQSLERGPGATEEARRASLDRGLEGSAAFVGPPAAAPVAAAAPVGAHRARPASSLGIQSIADAWPDARRNELDALVDRLEAMATIFAPTGDVPHAPGIDALVTRVDLAVRYASTLLYHGARKAGIPEDVIERGAASAARALSERLFGAPGRVYAVGRGLLREPEQELVGQAGPGGRVRPIAFGLRDEHGSVALKATVESDARPGGAA